MTDEFGIAGKTLLVTGSGRNLGKAIVLEFAARGANVVVNSRANADEARAVAHADSAHDFSSTLNRNAPSEDHDLPVV